MMPVKFAFYILFSEIAKFCEATWRPKGLRYILIATPLLLS